MRIVIIGAGVVGFHLAEQLSTEGHDISVVDSNADLVRRIDEKLDVLATRGDASTPSVLRRARVEGADLAIAVTDRDTTNIVVSMLARKMGAKKCIVRVRNREFTGDDAVLTADEIGANLVINPVQTTANLLEKLVHNPGATDVAEFEEGDLLLWGFIVAQDSPLVNVPLMELRAKYGATLDALIVAVCRPDGTLVIPRGQDVLYAGDNIYVFIRRKSTGEFRRLVQPQAKKVDRVVIGGATPLGIELARRLEGRVKSVVLVENNLKRAERASEELEKTLVLNGDLLDPDFCHEYGIENVQFFLALHGDDQTNLMHGLLVKKWGARQVVVQAQQPHYVPVLRSLSLGLVVTPRLLTVSEILRHIRRGRVLYVSRIGETGAEAREYLATPNSRLVGKPLREVGVPQGSIIGAIFRRETFMIPDGETVVEPNDHVVIFALPVAMKAVESLFEKKKLFQR